MRANRITVRRRCADDALSGRVETPEIAGRRVECAVVVQLTVVGERERTHGASIDRVRFLCGCGHVYAISYA